jgi:hypothetical protein
MSADEIDSKFHAKNSVFADIQLSHFHKPEVPIPPYVAIKL